MFKHRIDEEVSLHTYFDWFLLSFSAGSINAGGFLSSQRFVSHVTGFFTLAGIDFSRLSFLNAIATMTIPLFFIAGVMISAFLTEKQSSEHGKHKYAPVMGSVGLLLLAASILGHFGFFGAFGAPANLSHDYVLLAILCGACGLQNAAITSSSGSTIRTTHLTGLTTDLGIGIVRSEIHVKNKDQQYKDRKMNSLRLLTILSFTLGSLLGAFLFFSVQYMGFVFPALISFYAAWRSRNS